MNYLKTGILLIGLTLLLVGVGQMVGGTQGAVMAFAMALLMNGITYWFSDKIVLAMYRAKPVTEAESPRLASIVREIAHRAQMPMPKMYIVQSATPNAFATGRNPQHAAVAVTTGILELLNEQEMKGVLAHELSHVRNRDTLTMCLAAAIAGAVMMLARWAQWAMWFGGGRSRDERQSNGALQLVALLLVIILAPLAATLIQLAISRSREYGADASGARMAGTPLGLMDALRKLEMGNQRLPMDVNPSVAPLCIVNPLSGRSIAALFSTHPPMEERIKRLRQMVG